jgi:hypothetical protein
MSPYARGLSPAPAKARPPFAFERLLGRPVYFDYFGPVCQA